jgi:hypothetical protein
LGTKCVTGDFLQLTFNDVGQGEGEGGSKVISKPSADSFTVGRRQKGLMALASDIKLIRPDTTL